MDTVECEGRYVAIGWIRGEVGEGCKRVYINRKSKIRQGWGREEAVGAGQEEERLQVDG